MKLALQFGYGMMGHCRDLIDQWHGGTVILSPRDLEPAQLRALAADLVRRPGANVLVDPQLYVPSSDHPRLNRHEFFPSEAGTGQLWGSVAQTAMLSHLVSLNREIGSEGVIAPAEFVSAPGSDWLDLHEQLLVDLAAMAPEAFRYATLALSSDVVKSGEQIGEIIEAVERWPAQGVYLVCEHPTGAYFVDDPSWLANVLDLIAGLSLLDRRVIVGYCNQQLLSAAACGCAAIGSGTWLNTRAFPPAKFEAQLDDEIRRRAIWYYLPQALSELKLPFLDFAADNGVLDTLKPEHTVDAGFANMLFSGPQPTVSGFGERDSFRHFLGCVRNQAKAAKYGSFDDAIAGELQRLEEAQRVCGGLAALGIRGQDRDFGDLVDVNRAALAQLSRNYGAKLRRRWQQLPT